MNERINNRADRLTAEVVERAKGVNYKTDGYSWNKFSNWLRELLRKEFLDQELEVFAEESEKLECVRGQLLKAEFKVNTPGLLREIVLGSGQDIYRIPILILKGLLADVATRASEINDPEMDALMCKLALYEISNPESPEYDAQAVQLIINNAKHL